MNNNINVSADYDRLCDRINIAIHTSDSTRVKQLDELDIVDCIALRTIGRRIAAYANYSIQIANKKEQEDQKRLSEEINDLLSE